VQLLNVLLINAALFREPDNSGPKNQDQKVFHKQCGNKCPTNLSREEAKCCFACQSHCYDAQVQMAVMKREWRWIAGLVAVLVVVAAVLFVMRREQQLLVRPTAAVLPADGREHAVLLVVRPDGGPVKVGEVVVEVLAALGRDDVGDTRIVQTGKEIEVWMRASVMAEERRVRVRWGRQAVVRTVRFAPNDADSFEDGLPDALRLHSVEDRTAFRQWFWRLADVQAELPDAEKAGEIQDCAALLRYSYREALKAHDAEWAGAQHIGDVAFESVRQWRYPETMLGSGLFRVRPGPFVEGDESKGAFAQFADAHALMLWNTYRVGRSLRAAKPGDLIFFRQLEQNSPYHSMVITGTDADWVVYHTGPIGKRNGEMRRMTLADLLRHPDARWRPVAENSNFLGVFRWNVLREGD
jgi:hypothetical protein